MSDARITLSDFRIIVLNALKEAQPTPVPKSDESRWRHQPVDNVFSVLTSLIDKHYQSITTDSLGYSKSDGYKDNGSTAMNKKELFDKLYNEILDFGWNKGLTDLHVDPVSVEYQLKYPRKNLLHFKVDTDGLECQLVCGSAASSLYVLWGGDDPSDPYLKHLTGWLDELGGGLSGYDLSKLASLVLLAYENRPDYHSRSWRLLPDPAVVPDPHARMSDAADAYMKPNLFKEES